jgi:hypothetical protein
MRISEYTKLRTGVQLNARPATMPDVRSMALQLQQALRATGLFVEVEVDWTDNADHMVVCMCAYDPALSEEQAAAWLEQVWGQRLRFAYWAVHSTLVTDGQVELQAATMSGQGGPYLTLHVVAQRAHIPAQRVPVD